MGKIVRMPYSRTPSGGKDGGEAALKLTSFFSEGMGGFFMKWTYSTDVKGYRKVMIGGVQLDCEGCPKKVRLAIGRTDGVMQVRTDMDNEIVCVMGKNMNLSELRKNVRLESKFAEILDILPWKINMNLIHVEIVYAMGKNMNLSELRKNVRIESMFAEILDILPWKIKY